MSSSGDGTAPVPLHSAFQMHSDASTTSTALREGAHARGSIYLRLQTTL